MGLYGSKSIKSFISFPSSFNTFPQYRISPLFGVLVYNLRPIYFFLTKN